MPKVFNKRTDTIPDDAVFVGRPSKWGNPYRIGTHGNRSQVVAYYRAYLFSTHWLAMEAKRELKGKNLVCWCSPLPCHADVLLEMANA